MKHLLIAVILTFYATGYIIQPVNGDDTPEVTLHSSTPQEALNKFTKLMFSGTSRGGNTRDLAQALTLVEPHYTNGKPESQSDLLAKAKDLVFLLNSVNYNPDEIKIIAKNGDINLLEIGDEESSIQLAMEKNDKYGWIFADENFTSKEYDSALKHVASVRENIAEYATQFVTDLSSPLNTLYTFSYGVQGIHGYTLKDAVQALDLSRLDPKVAAGLGPTWAIQAYRMLRYASQVSPESISNNPQYKGNVILLLDPDYGMISMRLCTDPETEKKAWKIEYSGTSNINGIYDSFMRRGMINELNKMGVKDPTLHIILDDFFQLHIPFMEKQLLGINIWKIVLTILLMLSSFIILPVVRYISLPVINFILRKLSVTSSQDANKRFILPLQIIIVAIIWIYGIVIITASPKIMAATIVALNIILCLTLTLLACRIIDSSCSVAADRVNTSLHILTSVLGKLLKLMILVIAGLYICFIFNIDTTSFLAALGIGGFAFALAGKDTIENFFGSIMIIIDRPFHNGDMITISGIEGTIEQVGVRSTRIRTFDDTIITIPNRMFISSAVENLTMRKWRRYKTTFDILYETDIEKIAALTKGLAELAHLHPDSKKDSIQVFFYSLESYSLQIYISIFFRNRGRIEELKAREAFNTQAMYLAREMGIEFAYPTQKLFLSREEQPEHELPSADSAIPDVTDSHLSSRAVELARQISPYYKDTE